MSDAIIENPVINSPYQEPRRHFRFSEEGITDDIIDGRRPSSHFVPVPKPKSRWAFIEINDPWNAKGAIRSYVLAPSMAKEP